jgi:hypothetical protein
MSMASILASIGNYAMEIYEYRVRSCEPTTDGRSNFMASDAAISSSAPSGQHSDIKKTRDCTRMQQQRQIVSQPITL